MSKTSSHHNKTLATNRTAQRKYQRLECYEAGIKLLGSEVKSIKHGRASIEGAYVVVRGGEAFVTEMSVPAWQPQNPSSAHEVDRPRKLLLTQKKLAELELYDQKKGFAIILFSLYNKRGLIKADICVAKNKTTRDKRQEIKRRDTERDLRRSLKN